MSLAGELSSVELRPLGLLADESRPRRDRHRVTGGSPMTRQQCRP
jgi:hypothetical protein